MKQGRYLSDILATLDSSELEEVIVMSAKQIF